MGEGENPGEDSEGVKEGRRRQATDRYREELE